MCKISVIMPVYNCEKFVAFAIDSILNQTFSDIELIIIDDCSIDKTKDIVRAYKDQRIIFVENKKNLGIAKSLNKGLEIAKGKYIARMDGDDISKPDRFKIQYEFMEKNKNVAMCGSLIEVFNKKEKYIHRVPLNNDEIKVLQLFNSAFAHPVIFLRKEIIDKYNFRYDEYFEGMEDYDLWLRISHNHNIRNINKVLLEYRVHENQVTKKMTVIQKERALEIRRRNLKSISEEFTENEIQVFFEYCQNLILNNEEKLNKLFGVFRKLIENNKEKEIINQKVLKNVISYNIYWSIMKYKSITGLELDYKKYNDLIEEKIKIKIFIKRYLGKA